MRDCIMFVQQKTSLCVDLASAKIMVQTGYRWHLLFVSLRIVTGHFLRVTKNSAQFLFPRIHGPVHNVVYNNPPHHYSLVKFM